MYYPYCASRFFLELQNKSSPINIAIEVYFSQDVIVYLQPLHSRS